MPGLNMLAGVFQCFGLLILSLCVTFVAPTFKESFQEMHVELPLYTRLVLAVPPLVYNLLLLAAGVGLLLKERRLPDKHKALRLNALAGLGIFISFILFWIALYLPMFAALLSLD